MQFEPVSNTVKAPATNFTGDVYLTPIRKPDEQSRVFAAQVRFTPGARTNWHSHARGQTLHITEGEGFVVNRDGTVLRVRAGDTVWTPPGEEHWHGGTAGHLMCHLALFEGTSDGDGATWLEPVTEEQYANAEATGRTITA